MGEFIFVAGPSGSGKTAVARATIARVNGARMVPSVTNRERRPDDIDGEYEYVQWPAEEFERMVDAGQFLWSVNPHGGTCYGTRAIDINRIAATAGAIGIMILVPHKVAAAYRYVRSTFPDSVRIRSVFIRQDDEELLKCRLLARPGAEPSTVMRRIHADKLWLGQAQQLVLTREVPFMFIDGGRKPEMIPKIVDQILAD